MEEFTVSIKRLKSALETRAFIQADKEIILGMNQQLLKSGWLFDIRRIILNGEFLQDVSIVFWNTFRSSYPFQIGGLESGAIPIVAGLVSYGRYQENFDNISGFYIRKGRKKSGLMRRIEGEIQNNRPIILVDDLIGSGKTFIQQVEILEECGYVIQALWVVVRFREMNYYEYFTKKKIPIYSIFTLDDFRDSLGTKVLTEDTSLAPSQPFHTVWKFASKNPNYQYVEPKSDPCIDATRIYMGSDYGILWAIHQNDGTVAWSYNTKSFGFGKGVFSSPLVYRGNVYFASSNGNIYALNADTGKRLWISFEADSITSSPIAAPSLGLIFIGLEFGLFRKRGGIAALDALTGKSKWIYRDMPCITQGTAVFIQKRKCVAIGSNDGAVYLFDARVGTLIWKSMSFEISQEDIDTGSTVYAIQGSLTYDEKHDRLIALTLSGSILFIDMRNGNIVHEIKNEIKCYSTPLIYKNTVIITSLDKNVYCFDMATFDEKWKWYAGARIFASPTMVEGSIYVGANTGRLTEIDPESGIEKSFVTLTERITNAISYNPSTKRFFVSTHANEIYCLERKDWKGTEEKNTP